MSRGTVWRWGRGGLKSGGPGAGRSRNEGGAVFWADDSARLLRSSQVGRIPDGRARVLLYGTLQDGGRCPLPASQRAARRDVRAAAWRRERPQTGGPPAANARCGAARRAHALWPRRATSESGRGPPRRGARIVWTRLHPSRPVRPEDRPWA